MGLEIVINSLEKEYEIDSIPEGIYITGKLALNKVNKKIYRLKLNKEHSYFRLEYSANSNLVKFALTTDYSLEDNDNFKNMNLTDESGRKLLTIKFDEEFFLKNDSLYLKVFTQEKNIDSKLDSFVFKYLTAKNIDEFIPFLP